MVVSLFNGADGKSDDIFPVTFPYLERLKEPLLGSQAVS